MNDELTGLQQPDALMAKDIPRYRICDHYANVSLRNQFDESLRFHRHFVADGRALLINTMYTTCRGSCPITSTVLQSLREVLSPIFGTRLSIVSLSIDPQIDSPERLRNYAARYGADRRRAELCEWHFLTGKVADVDTLRRSLGFYDLNPQVDRDITQHASTLLFGNSTSDRWASLPASLSKSSLISTIRRIAGFTFEQRYAIQP